MLLINRKQGTFSCGDYTFPFNVPVEVPDDLAKKFLERPSLLLEVYEEGSHGKKETKEEKK